MQTGNMVKLKVHGLLVQLFGHKYKRLFLPYAIRSKEKFAMQRFKNYG